MLTPTDTSPILSTIHSNQTHTHSPIQTPFPQSKPSLNRGGFSAPTLPHTHTCAVLLSFGRSALNWETALSYRFPSCPLKSPQSCLFTSSNDVSAPVMNVLMNLGLINGFRTAAGASPLNTRIKHTSSSGKHSSPPIQLLGENDRAIQTDNHSPLPSPLAGTDCICLFNVTPGACARHA